MSTESDNRPDAVTYRVISVEKTEPPEGMPLADWHHYIIRRGKSIIEGSQIGSLKAVTQYAEEFVEGLNERAVKGGSTYTARKKK